MPNSALALLITAPDGTHRVLLGSDERAYRHAFGAFVDAWGPSAVWYDDLSKQLGSEGGVTMSRWRAKALGERKCLALVVLVGDCVVGIYLVDDAAMAQRASMALDRDGVAFELVATEPLPPPDPILDAIPLEGVVRIRHGIGRPPAPAPALSDEICLRCGDHPLHSEPLFDARSGEGERVCVACARLATLRERGGRAAS